MFVALKIEGAKVPNATLRMIMLMAQKLPLMKFLGLLQNPRMTGYVPKTFQQHRTLHNRIQSQ